jgi:hypothetical protein
VSPTNPIIIEVQNHILLEGIDLYQTTKTLTPLLPFFGNGKNISC